MSGDLNEHKKRKQPDTKRETTSVIFRRELGQGHSVSSLPRALFLQLRLGAIWTFMLVGLVACCWTLTQWHLPAGVRVVGGKQSSSHVMLAAHAGYLSGLALYLQCLEVPEP